MILSTLLALAPDVWASGGGPGGPPSGFYPKVDIKRVIARTPPTVVKLRRLRVRGGVPARRVRRMLLAAAAEAQACTALEVARLGGRLSIDLQVAPDGTTRASLGRSSLGLALIDFCIRGVYERLRFPGRRRPTRIQAQLLFVSRSPHSHTLRASPPSSKRRRGP